MQFLREKPVGKERQNPENTPHQTENSAQQISGIQNIRPLDHLTGRNGGRQKQELLLRFSLSAEIQKRKRPDPCRNAEIPPAGGKHIGGKADRKHDPCWFFQGLPFVHDDRPPVIKRPFVSFVARIPFIRSMRRRLYYHHTTWPARLQQFYVARKIKVQQSAPEHRVIFDR